MEIFSFDQATSIYRWTRLLPAVFGILTAVIAVLNIILTDRISTHKKAEEEKTKTRLETAEKQLISTQSIADTAKKTAEQLKEASRPRHITSEQATRIVESLKNSAKYNIEIQCILNNDEAWHFAEQIKRIFESAGFSFERIVPVMTVPPIKGIQIKTKAQYDKSMDKAVAELLRSQNKPLTVTLDANNKSDITIQIGQK